MRAHYKVTTTCQILDAAPNQAVLCVGDLGNGINQEWMASTTAPVFASFADVSIELMDSFCPEIVASPLFSDGFDAAELAERLERLGFDGRFVVIAPPVPNVRMIQNDIANLAPSVDIDVRVLWHH